MLTYNSGGSYEASLALYEPKKQTIKGRRARDCHACHKWQLMQTCTREDNATRDELICNGVSERDVGTRNVRSLRVLFGIFNHIGCFLESLEAAILRMYLDLSQQSTKSQARGY